MKSFKTHLREMYDTSPVDTKKKMKDVEEPLKGKGYPYNEDDEKNFKPHMMYDPKTGKGYKAKTYKDHLRMDKMGYVHDKPEVKEVKKKGKHDCATHVEHAEFGEGQCIHSQHATPDEDGNIAWYDVMFEHGIEKGVSINELKVVASEMHEDHHHDVKEATRLMSQGMTSIYQADTRAEYQKLYGAASQAMDDKMVGRGGMVGDRSKLTVKIAFKDEKSRKKFEKMNNIKESVELDESGDPRIAKLSFKAKEILANMANSLDTTGGPYLDNRNVKFLTRRGVENTLKAASRIPKGNKRAAQDLAILKKELGESVELGEQTKEFYNEVHAELKKVMDSKYYREFRASNGGRALENVINHMGKSRGWRVDKTVKSIIGKYGKNRDEYVKLSFQSAAKGRMRESVELDEAKTITLVAKKGKKTVETVKKVTPKEQKTVEMLLKTAHGKDITIEVVKESVELDEASEKQMIDMLRKEYGKISKVDPSSPTYKKLTGLLDNLAKNNPSLLKKLSKAKIKFVSPLALNRVNRKKMDEKVMGALPGGSPTRKFEVPPSPDVKSHILQTKKSEFLYSADSVLGGNSKFVVISTKRHKIAGEDGVMMAIISNPDRGSRKIFSYFGTHRNVAGAKKFAKNNKLIS